jgi:two-component system, LuxR family, sensor kinase FixL
MGSRDPSSGEADARPLTRRYLAALVLVGSLLLLDRALVQPPLFRLLTDAPVINLSGRQRMLSQRLAKAALALQSADGAPDRERRRDELEATLRLWTSSHDQLRRSNTAEINAAFDDLEPFYRRIRADAERLLTVDEGATTRASLASLLAAEPEYLPRMDRIVGLYEREAQARVDRLIWTGWGVTALLLVALAGIGRFVLRPAARVIERQVAELRDARDQLETRVRERTRELEQANRDRAAAEERQRALIEQFSHVARTTVVGEIASGLAHEISQPLGAIANYAEGCLVALDAPEPALGEIRAALGKVLATTLRAGAIVKRIRRFVTRHGTTRERFDPNPLARDVEEFFRDEAQRLNVTLRLELAPDLPCLHGDPVQVQQVLVNLARNALDALAVSQPLDPTVVLWTAVVGDGTVEFGVRDNGEGIPGDRLGHIFDAYFSTRDEGMGMGLAISRTIVVAHQGRIDVDSEPGKGATFRVTLPVASAEADEEGADGLHLG